MMITWSIAIVMSVAITGQAAVWNGSSKWSYKYQFVDEQSCKDHKRSGAFLDEMVALEVTARKMIGDPHAKVDIDTVCEADGDPV